MHTLFIPMIPFCQPFASVPKNGQGQKPPLHMYIQPFCQTELCCDQGDGSYVSWLLAMVLVVVD